MQYLLSDSFSFIPFTVCYKRAGKYNILQSKIDNVYVVEYENSYISLPESFHHNYNMKTKIISAIIDSSDSCFINQ